MLVVNAPELFPGQSPWILRTARGLDEGLRTNVTILNALETIQGLLIEQWRRDLIGLEIPEFIEWASTLDFASIDGAIPHESEIPSLKTGRADLGINDAFAEWDGVPLDKKDVDRIRTLITQPAALRDLTIQTTSDFWKRRLEPEFERLEPRIREVIDRGNANRAHRTGREFILELVGREPVADSIEKRNFDEAIGIPVCHLGSWVFTFYTGDGRYALSVFEGAKAPLSGVLESPTTTALTYRALADETRLRIVQLLSGGEMYGKEIVNACELSQPTVSKHLRILVSEGILTVRRDGGTKFYSVNRDRLSQIGRDVTDLPDT
jgi:DNA-binding transcriptional ArsR family regulator